MQNATASSTLYNLARVRSAVCWGLVAQASFNSYMLKMRDSR